MVCSYYHLSTSTYIEGIDRHRGAQNGKTPATEISSDPELLFRVS